MTTTPRIYVACLSSYNSGILHGDWIDVDDPESVREAIREILDNSPTAGAEEWAIHDHEGFGGLYIDEHDDIDKLCKIADAIREHGKPYAAWAEYDNGNVEIDDFIESYLGEFEDIADYAHHMAMDCYSEKDLGPFGQYIDWDRVGRDYELGGDVWTIPARYGHIYVFSN